MGPEPTSVGLVVLLLLLLLLVVVVVVVVVVWWLSLLCVCVVICSSIISISIMFIIVELKMMPESKQTTCGPTRKLRAHESTSACWSRKRVAIRGDEEVYVYVSWTSDSGADDDYDDTDWAHTHTYAFMCNYVCVRECVWCVWIYEFMNVCVCVCRAWTTVHEVPVRSVFIISNR